MSKLLINNNEFILSTEEICVAACLLGHTKLVGIDISKINRFKKLYVKNAINALESKELFFVTFDGTLKVKLTFKQVIDIICTPTSFLIIDEKRVNCERRTYYCRKGKYSVIITNDGVYHLTLIENLKIDMLFEFVTESGQDIFETISVSEYKKSKKNLSSKIDDKPYLSSMLNRNIPTLSIRLYKKSPAGYFCKLHSMFLLCEKTMIASVQDDMLMLKSISNIEMQKLMNRYKKNY